MQKSCSVPAPPTGGLLSRSLQSAAYASYKTIMRQRVALKQLHNLQCQSLCHADSKKGFFDLTDSLTATGRTR